MEVKLNKKKTIAHYNKLGPNMQNSEHSANKRGVVYSSVGDMIWKYREDRSRE